MTSLALIPEQIPERLQPHKLPTKQPARSTIGDAVGDPHNHHTHSKIARKRHARC